MFDVKLVGVSQPPVATDTIVKYASSVVCSSATGQHLMFEVEQVGVSKMSQKSFSLSATHAIINGCTIGLFYIVLGQDYDDKSLPL